MREPAPGRKRPTQSDVARRAGVSQPVVSYVLNRDSGAAVAPDTRRRVLAAVAELGYLPDRSGRGSRPRKTLLVAAIIPDITNPFYPAFIRGVQDVVRQNGYDLLLYNSDARAEEERRALLAARQNQVDGVIVGPMRTPLDDLVPLVDDGIAVVALTSYKPKLTVAIDTCHPLDREAARAAVRHLIERGHTRIAMILGQIGSHSRQERYLGYLEALAEHGITTCPALAQDGDFTEASGYRCMEHLLALPMRPTAIFAANDLMAVGAIRAIREAGPRIPADIAVVGFDDIPVARLLQPALTTVAAHPERLGARMAEMAVERIGRQVRPQPRYETMPLSLIIRDST